MEHSPAFRNPKRRSMMREGVSRISLVLLGCVALGSLFACDTIYDPGAVQKYAELRGTIRIPAELAPLLPKEAAEGDTVRAGAPGNDPASAYELPMIEADAPALVVKGEIAQYYTGGAVGPHTVWFKFKVDKKSSLTINCSWDNAGQDGFVPIVYEAKPGSADLEFLMWDLSATSPVSLTFVANPTSTYYLRWLKWFETDTPTAYQLAFSAVSGTVVGRILIGAYVSPEPFKIVPAGYSNENDPASAEAGYPKHPVGGTTATGLRMDEGNCNEDGNCDMVGWFDGLLIPVTECTQATAAEDCIPPICKDMLPWDKNLTKDDPMCAPSACVNGFCAYNIVAVADNDGGNSLNFSTDGPPTTADFITAKPVQVPNAQVDFSKGWKLYTMGEIKIDTPVVDDDFDGIYTGDGNGDGLPDDNCPSVYNPDQADSDGDGVGDVCDNCPDTPNPDQANTDKWELGDACNDARDPDGDEWENEFDVENVDHVPDNCPDVANADQADLDNDGMGDACDPDIDNDGVANENDNCPMRGNADQADSDADGVGDACDNCRGPMLDCLGNITLTTTYENRSDEFGAKWDACTRVATLALSECDAIRDYCLGMVKGDCYPSGNDCYSQANCTESNVNACEQQYSR
ncbi:MAG: hypothetical protein D6806_08660, partial [Deltaproteobacteria bacterium]